MASIQSTTCHNYLQLGNRKANILQDIYKSSETMEKEETRIPSVMYTNCSALESSASVTYKLTETACLRYELAF